MSGRPREVKLTHPDRLLWPADGIAKRDLYDYFGAVADVMVPHVKDRPVSLQRFRENVDKGGFFQKEVPKGAPDWVATAEVPKKGGVVHHVLANDRATLQWLAQQGCVTPHVFTARADLLDKPDRLVIDLDPSHEDFAAVRLAARQTGDALRARGLEPFAMVTGSRGVHVVVPLKRTRTTEAVLSWVRAFAAQLAQEQPETLTTEFYKNKRDDRIYLDVARNGHAQTVVPPYAPRPRAGAPVATPLTWDELDDDALRPDAWTLKTVLGRLADLGGDPWKDIATSARALPRG
ncbi:Multifunctional non-homologous end joining protein LigD [Baekduia alba]|uniref:non-homologous end-joining DNA ligase n=1 Tax=Baekduia alba TaxID=2997333 RepID=UPI0023422025|nr:non-homologous end-joining DNA ligase [Baekduia alba]WCB91348.1 Multifunctional non-homologous end joining protein LigD [Baekduia alba]